MKTHKRPRSMTAVTLWLVGALLLMWCAGAFCLTLATAQELYNELCTESASFPDYVSRRGEIDGIFEKNVAVNGNTDYRMIEAMGRTNTHLRSLTLRQNNAVRLMRDTQIEMDTAVIFYDKSGSILNKSGNFVYFSYISKDAWDAGDEEKAESSAGYFSIGDGGENDPYARFRSMYAGTKSLHDIRVLRITGSVRGAEIMPVKIDFLTETMLSQAVAEIEPKEQYTDEDGSEVTVREYLISELDRAGKLEWQNQLDSGSDGGELQTVYALNPKISIYEGKSLEYQGARYESLLALTEDLAAHTGGAADYRLTVNAADEYSLERIIAFNARYYRDPRGFADGAVPEPELVMVTAIMSRPLAAAMSGLRYVYIGTGLLALILLLALRSVIKRRLIEPICAVNRASEIGWGRLDAEPAWREPYELAKHFESSADDARMNKNELTRLKTALEYAKTAEQNRRQTISNIAHELKTPLAVIHGYAEGLKEHIADGKRDKYLDVILSESERMDAMVLEMLDLSRLEAGKVKLSRDEFSLGGLARAVFDKLEIAAQAKELKVDFSVPEDSTVTADEARIGQAVENLASNAVKYTPFGGAVHVRISKTRSGISFAVENDSAPLSAEALNKVWDTFYRADESRTGGGTGLGLAITKNIIELHGGKCTARNTKAGVEFGFFL